MDNSQFQIFLQLIRYRHRCNFRFLLLFQIYIIRYTGDSLSSVLVGTSTPLMMPNVFKRIQLYQFLDKFNELYTVVSAYLGIRLFRPN